jgi:hypothetical protein
VADPDTGSSAFLTLDTGSGMKNFGSGINILDPQHCRDVWRLVAVLDTVLYYFKKLIESERKKNSSGSSKTNKERIKLTAKIQLTHLDF